MPPLCIAAVALYGTKTGVLKGLLEAIQEICSKRLRDGFVPYTLDQIHSTVIRLDGRTHAKTGLLVNQHYLELAGVPGAMNYVRAVEILMTYLNPPLSIRIGGFKPNSPATFSSRDQRPYERMFSAQDGSLVLIGWPVNTVTNGITDRPLDDLRRKMNEANILHWYHKTWNDVDNDFHLVVGHYNSDSQRKAKEAVAASRVYLSQHPIQVEVGVNQVIVIAADSPTLESARFIDRLPIDPADIMNLYR
jgi:hypothetical protein